MKESIKQTPMMDQYLRFKKQYPGKIVLFRMGDFFETFGEDAKITSKVLNITLTTRDKKTNPTPLAGFPHKALKQYLSKLISSGYCAVIVDQLEDPKLSKGIVKRGVTRIVTPGTLEQEDSVKSNYICSFCKIKKDLGVSICDISTGELIWIDLLYSKQNIESVLSSFDPSEILLLENEKDLKFPTLPVQFLSKGLSNSKYSEEIIKEFFDVSSLHSLGLESKDVCICSLAMMLKHIRDTQLMEPVHIRKPKRRNITGNMVLDRATIRNLELVRGSFKDDIQGSLFSVIDFTSTQMGRRLLYSWILNPLIQKKDIDRRLNTVETFLNRKDVLDRTKEFLSDVNDIERIVGKIGLGRVNGRDLKALQTSLEAICLLNEIFSSVPTLKNIFKEYLSMLNKVKEEIEECIIELPPTTILEGGIIKSSYNEKVKELRDLTGDSKSWIRDFEEKEKESTKISSLKIGFNKVFGYYIEVTKTHQDKVPERYIRKQTLVNSERYITQDLKEKEEIILNAQEKLDELEYELFNEFRESLMQYISPLQELSNIVAEVDILSGFAQLSLERDYVKPKIYEMGEKMGVIKIEGGRHPIVEVLSEEEFISNDTHLDFGNNLLSILTGPNMSGKSTYIRQVATLVLLSQIGCFVPAESMQVSLVDRIFTRVGASDDLSKGRSTFMVEMDEAANIVNNATKYSLIVLDEVGRGTSTYDGVSIAWALAEFLANEVKARTLFATHYHELVKLSEKIPNRVRNYNILVEEDLAEGTVIFLRKIVEGGTDRSYGIYVAKMAGLPDKVIKRANEILEGFEQEKMFVSESNVREGSIIDSKLSGREKTIDQIPLFSTKESEIEKEIQEIDIDNITPMEALNKVLEWKKKI
jgi:DNA mismatch repair protein MutS